jgi:exosortase
METNITTRTGNLETMSAVGRKQLIVWGVLGACLLWAYGSTLASIAERWATNSTYSHGYLVPLFSVWLLWLRRKRIIGQSIQGSWWGMPILLLGVGMHLLGAWLYLDALAEAAFLPTLAGFCIAVGGWTAFRWAWPSIAYLAFMLPLPYRVEVAMAQPLQRLATIASTYLLQLLGFSAVSEGNIILMDNAPPIGVVDACNGLGMMVTFFALTTAGAIVINRPLLDRLVVLASTVPIALAANVIRITVTGILYKTVGEVDIDFHGWAGWFMMPLAIGLMWIELAILGRLLVAAPPEEQATMTFGTPSRSFNKEAVKAKS